MRLGRLANRLLSSTFALALMSAAPLHMMAQDDHPHASTTLTAEQKAQQSALINIVRQATEKYKDVRVAEHDGYKLQFGCVSGDTSGAMGLHFVNGDIVNNGVINPYRPQIVIYEPAADGHLQLIGADFLVFADAWDKNNSGPPELMGQLFHLFSAPNRFLLPSFYTLHVWAWKDNPNGAFVNWHPNVNCEQFGGEKTVP